MQFSGNRPTGSVESKVKHFCLIFSRTTGSAWPVNEDLREKASDGIVVK
jgi:hypothetical protein